MKCPVCNVDLLMAERQGVGIDYCPTCRGIWLERGKLEQFIERTPQIISQNNARNYTKDKFVDDFDEHHDRHHDYDDEDDHHYKGKHNDEYEVDKYGRKRKKRGFFDFLDIGD